MCESFFCDYYESGDDGVAGGGRRHLGLHGELELLACSEGGATCHHAMALGLGTWPGLPEFGPLKSWSATVIKIKINKNKQIPTEQYIKLLR